MSDELINYKISKYGLFINMNKYNNQCEIFHSTHICNSLDDCKNKLIDYLVLQFNNLYIDFPLDILDFEYIYLNQNYINTNIFNYSIFHEDQWIHPWEHQDIYTDVLNKLHENDINDYEKNVNEYLSESEQGNVDSEEGNIDSEQ